MFIYLCEKVKLRLQQIIKNNFIWQHYSKETWKRVLQKRLRLHSAPLK